MQWETNNYGFCLFVLGHDDQHADGGEERERDGGEGGDCVSIVRFQGENDRGGIISLIKTK